MFTVVYLDSVTLLPHPNPLLRQIMHFAAQTHVDVSFGNSVAFTKNNALGTHVLLEAVRERIPQITCVALSHLIAAVTTTHHRRFVHVSTDEVYGENEDDAAAFSDHPSSVFAPSNPYAATKAAAEMLVKVCLLRHMY